MSVSYPDQYRNYCVVELPQRRNLSEIKTSLDNPKSEDTVIEDLYELNLMLDEGNTEVATIYPTLSKYNQTNSPNIQSFLAGIYRKTKVPDAFGPLIAMLVRNAINQSNTKTNNNKQEVPYSSSSYTHSLTLSYTPDPNEEIGGAILDYLA